MALSGALWSQMAIWAHQLPASCIYVPPFWSCPSTLDGRAQLILLKATRVAVWGTLLPLSDC